MPTFRFDEREHAYFLNGIKIPSATQIVARLFPNTFANVPEAVLARAALRGTRVHADIAGVLSGEFETGATDEGRAMLDELKRLKYTPWKIEQSIYYLEGGTAVAGTPDLIAINSKGQYVIVDYKITRAANFDEWTVQLNIYKLLAEQYYDIKIDALCLLRYKDTPEPFIIQMLSTSDILTLIKEAINV